MVCAHFVLTYSVWLGWWLVLICYDRKVYSVWLGWWLVLICYERKVLLVGWWLVLIWYERKTLLAGWLTNKKKTFPISGKKRFHFHGWLLVSNLDTKPRKSRRPAIFFTRGAIAYCVSIWSPTSHSSHMAPCYESNQLFSMAYMSPFHDAHRWPRSLSPHELQCHLDPRTIVFVMPSEGYKRSNY